MSYLITKDYLRIIQPTELNQITSSDTSVRGLVEDSVQQEMRAYLIQKYDLTKEFSDTSLFSLSVAYKGGQRVYLDANAYADTATYTLNSLAVYSGVVYICTTAITTPEAFTIGKWTVLGNQYAIYYVTLPKEEFDHKKFYFAGDEVFWKDKTYTAQRASVAGSHESDLQSMQSENIHRANPFPDQSSGLSMWGSGTPFVVAAGTLVTDTAKWTFGDNRNQLFVRVMLDMVVYELSKRIAPNNVPEARHNAWVRAVEIMKGFAKGNMTAELPQIQPSQGAPIRWGGDVKRINNY